MEPKVYVGNLPFTATEDDLRTLFAQAGNVVSVVMIKDRETGASRGFAFVEYATQEEAQKAVSTFNSYTFGNRPLKDSIARPREERSDFGGGNRGSFNRGGPRRNSSGGGSRY